MNVGRNENALEPNWLFIYLQLSGEDFLSARCQPVSNASSGPMLFRVASRIFRIRPLSRGGGKDVRQHIQHEFILLFQFLAREYIQYNQVYSQQICLLTLYLLVFSSSSNVSRGY